MGCNGLCLVSRVQSGWAAIYVGGKTFPSASILLLWQCRGASCDRLVSCSSQRSTNLEACVRHLLITHHLLSLVLPPGAMDDSLDIYILCKPLRWVHMATFCEPWRVQSGQRNLPASESAFFESETGHYIAQAPSHGQPESGCLLWHVSERTIQIYQGVTGDMH